ncbi:MAG: GNAT family N-acetyltransferase [Chloroflexota bacterium]|nr:GNAT family N-acetyltransferase [Chloroflexota bacterium]
MAYTMRSALYLSMNELADAQTAAYGGGWQSSVVKLAETCKVQSIDLGHSIAVFDGRSTVAIALVGRRTDRGWLYDIAVAPAHRGGGMATRMMHTVLDDMRAGGTREVELDVAAMRGDAIRLYTRLGFERSRSYLNLAATGTELGLDRVELAPGHTIVGGLPEQLIEAYARAQATEPAPCWDRSLASLLAYPDGYISRLLDGERELALMHYLARPAEGGDPDRVRPLFVHLAPGAGVETLVELLAATACAAFGDAGRLTLRVALEPESSTFTALLRELRMPVVAESYDMRLAL